MGVIVGTVPVFASTEADKAQAMKVVEEAAEVFGAWQTWVDGGWRAGDRNGGRPRPVVVDGRLFPSVAAAAEEVGMTAQHLGTRLRGGPCTVKGRRAAFAEDWA